MVEGFGLSPGVRVWVVSAWGSLPRWAAGAPARFRELARRAWVLLLTALRWCWRRSAWSPGRPTRGPARCRRAEASWGPGLPGITAAGLLVIAGTHWCLGRLHAWRRRLLVAKLVRSYSCALASGSWRRRWRWPGGSRRVGSHIASMRGPVCAIRSPGSAACRRVCRIPGWAPRAQPPCAVLPAGTPSRCRRHGCWVVPGRWATIPGCEVARAG